MAQRPEARVFKGIAVTGMANIGTRITGLDRRTGDGATGDISRDHVVNRAGMWARAVGRMAGVNVPRQACGHFHIVTETTPGLGRLPVLRGPDDCACVKEDAGKFLPDAFGPVAKPWGLNGIPESFGCDQIPEDLDHVEQILEAAITRTPMPAEAGLQTFLTPPRKPDPGQRLPSEPLRRAGQFLGGDRGQLYRHPLVDGVGGMGEHGDQMPFDPGDADMARIQPFQRNRRYLAKRAAKTPGLLCAR